MDRLLTGLQPSGSLTIGNYCGGISQVANYQKKYETFLFVPDMHAITVPDTSMNGARKHMRTIIWYVFCRFVMSVVRRVTKDDVEKWSMFPNENVWILPKTLSTRRCRVRSAPPRSYTGCSSRYL